MASRGRLGITLADSRDDPLMFAAVAAVPFRGEHAALQPAPYMLAASRDEQ